MEYIYVKTGKKEEQGSYFSMCLSTSITSAVVIWAKPLLVACRPGLDQLMKCCEASSAGVNDSDAVSPFSIDIGSLCGPSMVRCLIAPGGNNGF